MTRASLIYRLWAAGHQIRKSGARACVRKALDNLWGKAHFGARDYHGSGQQIIYAMPFSEVKDGVATLLLQLPPSHN